MAKKDCSMRVNAMKLNFKKEFDSGLSIREIEKKYGVSENYAYRILDEIAIINHISKEYFLQKKHSKHNYPTSKRSFKNDTYSFNAILNDINNLKVQLYHLENNLISLKENIKYDI